MTAQSCYHFTCPQYQHCVYQRHHKPCRHPQHQVQWFHELVQVIKARVYKAQADNELLRIVCPHCGRTWEGLAKHINHYAPGVIHGQHIPKCKLRSPKQRRQNNAKREYFWAIRPPHQFTIWNDYQHHGLQPEL